MVYLQLLGLDYIRFGWISMKSISTELLDAPAGPAVPENYASFQGFAFSAFSAGGCVVKYPVA
jgi:hypothetical protein